jgi:predicted GNAT family N-acyltransferase
MNRMVLIKPWQEARMDAYFVRETVFIQEQGVPEAMELDEFDPQALHALAYRESHCVGTGRLVALNSKEGRIGRMAVLKNSRGQGIGKQILQSLIELGQGQGLTKFILHAQLSAISFYEQFGFLAVGDTYDEAGIAHRDMILNTLTPTKN